MAGTLTIAGTLEFSVGEGTEDRAPIVNFGITEMAFDRESIKHLDYAGVVTDEDIFNAGMTAAKGFMISSSFHGGDIRINGGTAIPIAEGAGWIQYINPDGGITSLTVTTTDAAKFTLYMFE